MKHILFFLITLVLFLSSCGKDKTLNTKGLKPLYISKTLSNNVESEPAKSFTTVGKIFKLGNKIYISDVATGVHVIDNSTPSNPIKEAFISIYGNNDMAVKGDVMYADNGENLLAIDISNINDVEVVKMIKDVYEFSGQKFPVNHIGYFECADPDKGFIYDWVQADLVNPECKR